MFKKLMAALLATLLILSGVSAFAAEDIEIEASLLPALEMTATELYASDNSRVLFVTAVAIEVIFADHEGANEIMADAMLADRIYVAKDGNTLSVYFWGDTGCLLVLYKPSTNEIAAGIVDAGGVTVTSSMASQGMASLKADASFDSYYQVSGPAVVSMLTEIVNSID